MNYFFEWDPKKEAANRRKHGIAFSRASTLFNDSKALTIYDEKHSDDEERWVTLGIDSIGTLLVVCHTFVEESSSHCRLRIISARKATQKETMQYRGT